jgi:hypothetical protein
MPAFTAGGDITIGVNKLITSNCLLKQIDANSLGIRDAADTAYRRLYLSYIYWEDQIYCLTSIGGFRTRSADGAYITLESRDTGVGLAEIARMVGANWAHLLLTRARFGTTALTADADHRGGLYVVEGGAGVADKLYWIAKNSLDGYEAVQIATAS